MAGKVLSPAGIPAITEACPFKLVPIGQDQQGGIVFSALDICGKCKFNNKLTGKCRFDELFNDVRELKEKLLPRMGVL